MTARTTSLGLLGVILAALTLLPWFVDQAVFMPEQARANKGNQGLVSEARLPDLPDKERPPIERFSAIVERPVFIATRRPAFAPKPLADKNLVLGKYRITGVIISPEERFVMMTSAANKKTVTLRLGDKIDGWSLQEVSHGKIVLVSKKKKIVIHGNADR